jgi:hypothetical protein
MGLFRYILPRVSVIISEGFNIKITLPGKKQKKRCFLRNMAFFSKIGGSFTGTGIQCTGI